MNNNAHVQPAANLVNHTNIDVNKVKEYLLQLQKNICSGLENQESTGGIDGSSETKFIPDAWDRIKKGEKKGGGISCVFADGEVIEKSGVMFSHIFIDELPTSASKRYPQLHGAKAQAMGVSVIVHPKNPHVPTSHMNVRLFVAQPANPEEKPVWWFGGGFDLTPFYANKEDCKAWHQACFDVCQPFGEDVYPAFKKWCDEYFYIKHRNEQRGIGGIFYDDLNEATQVGNGWSFETCFAFMQAVGNAYINTLLPIIEKNKNTPYTAEQRNFQLVRRGRYVEYNLVYDRGTLFGLQSGGRIESILVSLPNMVSWEYKADYSEDSAEYQLTNYYLKKRDWLHD